MITLSSLGFGLAFLVGLLAFLVKRCLTRSQTHTAPQDSNASLLNSSHNSSLPKSSGPEENRATVSVDQRQSSEKIHTDDNHEEVLKVSESTQLILPDLGIPSKVSLLSLNKEPKESGVSETSISSRQFSLEDEFLMEEGNSIIAWLHDNNNNETAGSELDLSSIIKEGQTVMENGSDVIKKFEAIEKELCRVNTDADDMMHCINNAKRSDKISQIISQPLYPFPYRLTDVSLSKDAIESTESATKVNDRWGSVHNSDNFDEWSFDGQLGNNAAFEDGYEDN